MRDLAYLWLGKKPCRPGACGANSGNSKRGARYSVAGHGKKDIFCGCSSQSLGASTLAAPEQYVGNGLTARLIQQIQQACPAATNIEVQHLDRDTMRVKLQVRTDDELRDYAGRIYSLEVLQAYRTDMHITIEP